MSAEPVLLLKSIQGNAIRTLFEVLKEIVHDVCLRVDSTGVKLLTLDGARCALVYMRLRADAFEEFKCDGTFNLGLNMASMFKLVKTSGSHDTITLYMDSSTNNELGIKIQNSEKNSVTDFKLKLLDVDDEIITLPDVEFDSVITMPSAFFQRLCRDMLNISDTMIIKSTGNKLVLGCNGDFARQVRSHATGGASLLGAGGLLVAGGGGGLAAAGGAHELAAAGALVDDATLGVLAAGLGGGNLGGHCSTVPQENFSATPLGAPRRRRSSARPTRA